ncbi:putative membrane protein [Mycobacteroides abscessus subsp. bolletii 1513]|uniref:Putative membrane protein n=1 Tax=Mycobacteroides abscessus subsp. bolletii 1513 TaxID=1299321 RepID=X8E030_9MYCO|nr:putative membrane protein [Mycobacteroides abscessus subsp. bolletii 1513]
MIGVGDRFTALPFSLLLLAVEFVLVAVLRPSEGFGVFAPLVLLKCLRDCLIAVLFALLMRGRSCVQRCCSA